jgi:hypothetical protein
MGGIGRGYRTSHRRNEATVARARRVHELVRHERGGGRVTIVVVPGADREVITDGDRIRAVPIDQRCCPLASMDANGIRIDPDERPEEAPRGW